MRKTTRDYCKEGLMILLQKKPYSKITIKDISDYAEVSTVTFYNYFSGKGELFYECVHDAGSQCYERLGPDYTWKDYIQEYLIYNTEHIKSAVNMLLYAKGYENAQETAIRSNLDLMKKYICDHYGESALNRELETAIEVYLRGSIFYMAKIIRQENFNASEEAQYLTDCMPEILKQYIPH